MLSIPLNGFSARVIMAADLVAPPRSFNSIEWIQEREQRVEGWFWEAWAFNSIEWIRKEKFKEIARKFKYASFNSIEWVLCGEDEGPVFVRRDLSIPLNGFYEAQILDPELALDLSIPLNGFRLYYLALYRLKYRRSFNSIEWIRRPKREGYMLCYKSALSIPLNGF